MRAQSVSLFGTDKRAPLFSKKKKKSDIRVNVQNRCSDFEVVIWLMTFSYLCHPLFVVEFKISQYHSMVPESV